MVRVVNALDIIIIMYGGTVDQSSDIICDSCRIARASKHPVEKAENSQGVLAKKTMYNSIKSGDLRPGNRVSINQYSSTTRGKLTKRYGKAPKNDTYGGGTIFVDHGSGFIHVEHQESLCASDTIAAKRRFERLLYDRGISVCSYRADNSNFNAMGFEDEIRKEDQGFTFSGVGAQHQNGVAKVCDSYSY